MLVLPTLFGLTHEELAEKENKREESDGSAISECNLWVICSKLGGSNTESTAPGAARVKKVTFVDQDDPFGVASPSRLPIAKMSSNAWVSTINKRERYAY
jgi:ATP-dependent helicase IRC3